MAVSRRDFMRYCGATAATLGLTSLDLGLLQKALANPSAPSVIWLHGSGCTGCSVSFLNRVSTTAPTSAADVLISSINLLYHPTVMASAGESAVRLAQQAYNAGNYVLVVEGAIPTAFGGAPCWAWTFNGQDVTIQKAVKDMSTRALKVVCVGNCASFGGVPAAPPNVTGVQSVKTVTGKTTINIAGCPPHPDWIVWAIVQILTGKSISLDSDGRPTSLYGRTVHDQCPRREMDEAETFGIDKYCLKEIGCRGPDTKANCPGTKWNGAVNWCVDANAPCIACTEKAFPFSPVFDYDEDSHD
jgi:hydrogenase small subunit